MFLFDVFWIFFIFVMPLKSLVFYDIWNPLHFKFSSRFIIKVHFTYWHILWRIHFTCVTVFQNTVVSRLYQRKSYESLTSMESLLNSGNWHPFLLNFNSGRYIRSSPFRYWHFFGLVQHIVSNRCHNTTPVHQILGQKPKIIFSTSNIVTPNNMTLDSNIF